ncbi:MAG: hypothetical protein ACE5D7_11210, partial [Fidelibacterota bacterium]
MIIDSVEIIPYEISFAVPLKTSTRTIYDHNGFLIKITGNGFTGFGEAAPLPGFSPDTISDCHDCLLKFRDETGRNGYEQSFEDLVRNMDSSCQSSPAARFGIETAVVDLFSKTENKSFSYFLSPISFTSISINGLYRRGYKPPDGISITKIKV